MTAETSPEQVSSDDGEPARGNATRAAAEKAAAAFTAAGFPKMPARILMALLASERGSLAGAGLAKGLA